MHVGNTDCKLSMSLHSNILPTVNDVKDLGVVDIRACFTLTLIRILSAHLFEFNSQMFGFA